MITSTTTFKDVLAMNTIKKRKDTSLNTLASNAKSAFRDCGIHSPLEAKNMNASELKLLLNKSYGAEGGGKTTKLSPIVVEILEILGRHDVLGLNRDTDCVHSKVINDVDDVEDFSMSSDDGSCIDQSDACIPEPNNTFMLRQIIVDGQTVRYMISVISSQEEEIARETGQSSCALDVNLLHDAVDGMHTDTKELVCKAFAEKGGIVHVLGMYCSRQEAEFARQRCIDREYMESRDVSLVYGRHVAFDAGDKIDVFTLPQTIHVWDPEGNIIINVRNTKLDHIRVAAEQCLHNNKERTGFRNSTIRHRAACAIEFLKSSIPPPNALEPGNMYRLPQDQQDDLKGKTTLLDTIDTLVRTAAKRCQDVIQVVPKNDMPYTTLCSALAHQKTKTRSLQADLDNTREKLEALATELQATRNALDQAKQDKIDLMTKHIDAMHHALAK